MAEEFYIPLFLMLVVPLCFLFGMLFGKYVNYRRWLQILLTFLAVTTGAVWVVIGSFLSATGYNETSNGMFLLGLSPLYACMLFCGILFTLRTREKDYAPLGYAIVFVLVGSLFYLFYLGLWGIS